MKKKRIFLLAVLLILVFSLPVFATTVKKLKKGQKTLNLNVGNQFILKVKNARAARFKPRETGAFKLTGKGLIKAKKAGAGKIAYFIGNQRFLVTVRVKKPASTRASEEPAGGSGGSESSGGGGGTVYWVESGEVYHSTSSCPTLSRSRSIYSGSLSECPKSRPCKVCH